MLKALHAAEDVAEARKKALRVGAKLHEQRMTKAAELVEGGIEETLAYYTLPEEHWRRIRTNNPLERIMRGPQANPRSRRPSRRQLGPQPGRGQVEAHRRHALVDQTISEHGAAQAA